MAHSKNTSASQHSVFSDDRRVCASVYLSHLTIADGEWLTRTLPTLMRHTRPQTHAVRVEDVSLRYRSGKLGVADALDATASLLEPFAAAGAQLERRNDWYISDDDDEDDDDELRLLDTEQPVTLNDAPEQDLLVSARMVVDADGDDAGAAALYWAALALAAS